MLYIIYMTYCVLGFDCELKDQKKQIAAIFSDTTCLPAIIIVVLNKNTIMGTTY